MSNSFISCHIESETTKMKPEIYFFSLEKKKERNDNQHVQKGNFTDKYVGLCDKVSTKTLVTFLGLKMVERESRSEQQQWNAK